MIAIRKSILMNLSVTGLIVLFVCSVCLAQTPAAVSSTASVSGRVTISGKGAAGITVVAERSNDWPENNRTVAKTSTDDEGNYRLSGLAVGRFEIKPIAKAFVVVAGDSFKQPGQTVNIAENESITKIDFSLVRGGVITGRVTDLEGHPIIGERVNVVAKGDSESRSVSYFPGRKNQTDDRGIYRIYGLAPGSYTVSVGQATGGVNLVVSSQYAKTFYPGVTEQSKATPIEIGQGTEATNIDITPGKSARGFSVSGRVLDAESGKPVASVHIVYSTLNAANQQRGATNYTFVQSDANGKFRIEGIPSGHYTAFLMASWENSSYSDGAPFDISDADVSGIEIKVRRGATVEGVAVIEDNGDPTAAALLRSVSLTAFTTDEQSNGAPTSYSLGNINPDGSFRFAGLAPGKVRISMTFFAARAPTKGVQLLRTELDGVDQSEGLEVAAGAHITGVRLVFANGTGRIRGEVRVEGGVAPEGSRFRLSLNSGGNGAHQSSRFIEVDARRRFVAEDIPPGTYQLTLTPEPGTTAFEPVSRTISVANGTETQVILTVNFTEKAGIY
jgi:protocatechuate 3,4-dioxygenase beta subunit